MKPAKPAAPPSFPVLPVSGFRLLNHPIYNKDHAFTAKERQVLGLTGLLPTPELEIVAHV